MGAKLYTVAMLLRIYPVYLCVKLSRVESVIKEDILRWTSILRVPYRNAFGIMALGHLLIFYKEFRNLIIHRLGRNTLLGLITRFLFPRMDTLHIGCPDIGGGLYIQHGIATIISAKKIGRNCWVNQQVTIGYNGLEAPVLGDNVTVYAGAKIIGGVTIGNDVIVGANAVVCKSVPDNVVVGGVPSRVIRKR